MPKSAAATATEQQSAPPCGQAHAANSTAEQHFTEYDERRLRVELAAAEEQVLARVDEALRRAEAVERSDPVADVQTFLDKRKKAVPAPPPNSSRTALEAWAAPRD